MKAPDPSEAKLAWHLWNVLQQLSDLLWERYDQDFVSFTMEENYQQWRSTLADSHSSDDSSQDGSSIET